MYQCILQHNIHLTGVKYINDSVITLQILLSPNEALRYKPEGRGFDSRWCHWIFSLT